jgi:hypothetical protein
MFQSGLLWVEFKSLEQHYKAFSASGALNFETAHAEIANQTQPVARFELGAFSGGGLFGDEFFRRLAVFLDVDMDPLLDQFAILAAEQRALDGADISDLAGVLRPGRQSGEDEEKNC